MFWRLEQVEEHFRFLRPADFLQDEGLFKSLGCPLDESFAKSVRRGALLQSAARGGWQAEVYYFLNSPKGELLCGPSRAGSGARQDKRTVHDPPREPANIFRLYEENIGPCLTALIAETLSEAEDTYPAEWIEDALRIAVQRNKRTWRYCVRYPRALAREGRHDKKEPTKRSIRR